MGVLCFQTRLRRKLTRPIEAAKSRSHEWGNEDIHIECKCTKKDVSLVHSHLISKLRCTSISVSYLIDVIIRSDAYRRGKVKYPKKATVRTNRCILLIFSSIGLSLKRPANQSNRLPSSMISPRESIPRRRPTSLNIRMNELSITARSQRTPVKAELMSLARSG